MKICLIVMSCLVILLVVDLYSAEKNIGVVTVLEKNVMSMIKNFLIFNIFQQKSTNKPLMIGCWLMSEP